MHRTMKIHGMTCEHCAHAVEKALRAVPGVKEAKVNLEANSASIDGEAPEHALKAAVVSAGHEAGEIR